MQISFTSLIDKNPAANIQNIHNILKRRPEYEKGLFEALKQINDYSGTRDVFLNTGENSISISMQDEEGTTYSTELDFEKHNGENVTQVLKDFVLRFRKQEKNTSC